MAKAWTIVVLAIVCPFLSHAQDSLTLAERLANFPTKFLGSVERKASKMEARMVAYSQKALRRMERQEQKALRKLAKKDSVAAKALAQNNNEYQKLLSQVASGRNYASSAGNYIPHLDSLSSSLKFLDHYKADLPSWSTLNQTLDKVKAVQDRLKQADQIKAYIRQRRQELAEKLKEVGLVKELRKYNKQAYYYAAQIREYKSILSDPGKLEKEALRWVQKLPLFQQFMREHSELASMFRMPSGPLDLQSLQGLQTRASVQDLIQQRIAQGGPNAQAMLQQQLQQAQAQLNQLKNKITQLGGNGSDLDMPDFKPNSQRTKSFWKRLEVGTNIQSTKANYFFPTTTDLGLSLGYKLNDQGILGIGASYKMGWGKDIQHISFTSEGVGLRSYIDWKLKKSFYLSGGYEQNYRVRFDNISQLQQDPDNWQSSGLIGISKIISLKTKYLKKTKVQLLWDFLSYQQKPVTQPILFRIGYSF